MHARLLSFGKQCTDEALLIPCYPCIIVALQQAVKLLFNCFIVASSPFVIHLGAVCA